ncbi:MAG: bifunctional homocysteine S-methyltransferase/methylenetetrahydrofolate reductase [Lachnospiraceae bacterium]|nr:bifunctional homocysteine S-methyltransferase/methylenetetrahydrofolate reductase [Lachnospiraceae bacterium]
MTIQNYLKKHLLITDGAMGTYFDSKKSIQSQIAEDANITNPEMIKSIHKEYLANGANLIRTNTFAVNRSFALAKNLNEKEEQDALLIQLVRAACQIAKEAVTESEKEAWIAADIGPIAESLFYEYDYDEKEEYRLLIDAFLDCGIQIFDFETFSDFSVLSWAANYIKERNPEAFIIVSFALNRNGYTSKGYSIKRLFQEASSTDAIDCYGCNCLIGAAHMYDILKNQNFSSEKYVIALPNSGYPHILRGRTVYSGSMSYFSAKMEQIAHLGVNIIGGCCGTTPEHIKNIHQTIGNKPPYQKKVDIDAQTEIKISKTRNNDFMEKLEQGETVIAVELDPPFDHNAEKLLEGAYMLKHQKVDIITLADSPLARARADSILLASKIHNMVDIPVMPHIACRDRNRISMHSTILGAHINGIRNMLIVTGDPVPSGERDTTKSVFDFNSIRFMEYVKEINTELFQNDIISYGGALNQNQANLDKLIERMQKKIDAGVSYFLTQPIYSEQDIERIKIMKSRLNTKILCGIMPLVSYRNAMFIKNEMPGIFVPDEIIEQYDPQMTREEAEEIAKRISLSVIQKLKGIADGYYFMTPFNRVALICDIIDRMEDTNDKRNALFIN